jgi:heme/copper-type cytochrome/quinol oxidase subunit 3
LELFFFLVIMYNRFRIQRFSSWGHLSYEIAIWYWHFVDVI